MKTLFILLTCSEDKAVSVRSRRQLDTCLALAVAQDVSDFKIKVSQTNL